MSDEVQKCYTCRKVKPIKDFLKRTTGGFQGQCKKCRAEYMQNKYSPEAARQQSKKEADEWAFLQKLPMRY